MSSADHPIPHLKHVILHLRWVIPITLGALGLGYVVWENLIVDGHPVNSPEVLIGFALLGVAGPILTFLTLTWAGRAAASYERAEQARERQHRQLVALNTIGEAVNQSLDLDTVLNRAVDRVLNVMHLESGEVRLIEDGQLVLRTARGVSPTFIAAERSIPLGHCLCGKSAQTGELIAIEDLHRMPGLTRTTCACEQFRSVLCVPVRTTERVVGVIHVASHKPRTFDSAERTVLTAIGRRVGVAIEQAQLHTELKSLNQQLETRVAERTRELLAAKEELVRKADTLRWVLAEERRVEEKTRARIAHDLHDGVQQLIIGALFETQAAHDALSHPETAKTRIATVQDLLRRIESEMRGAIYNLRPVALDTQGLGPALRECVASFARVSQVECQLSVEGTPRRFNGDAEVAVLRIIQEALHNIEAHAHAKHARVAICFGARDLQAEVTDDGKGFDVAEVTRQARTQLGLIGMRERAESVGGTMEVQSRVGEGTRVILNVPIVKREE
jgi:signal transduction histidine kinase